MKKEVIIKKIKHFFLLLKKWFIKYKYIIFMGLPLILMDLMTRYLGNSIEFYKIYRFIPNFFTLLWISLFLSICLCLKGKVAKIVYSFFNIVFIIFYLINNVYFSMTANFFNFTLLESTGEGAPYMISALRNCNILVYIFLLIIIILFIIGLKNVPKERKINFRIFSIIFLCFLFLHGITPLLLGKANTSLVWSTWKNPRNIYNAFNDSNKSMRVSGLFEYTIRDFYIVYLKVEKEDEEDLEFLGQVYNNVSQNNSNKYSGKYEGKNLILLQLEGIDNWLITKEDTPTLYKMMDKSYNFLNHYSFYNGGGSTFNSEFSVNVGFTVPVTYNKNAYSFNQSTFPYTLAKTFKSKDYIVNAFHMNSKEYYSRGINYANWGYDNYYGLIDFQNYDNQLYKLDRELINNEKYSDLMFPVDKKFVDYIITYSAHLPFTNTKEVCKMLYELDNEGIENLEFKQMSEEECARRQAKETDYMVELLLKKLSEKEILDDTVIVVFTDHYLYTLEDQSILEKYKETKNNLINKTPFFIWSNDNKKVNIKSVTSQLNILPTVLNLFGFKYNSNNYIMSDALNSNFNGIVFFSDSSWYDGNLYVENGEVTNKKSISEEKLEEKIYNVTNLIKKNDLTLKYDYFKKMNQ